MGAQCNRRFRWSSLLRSTQGRRKGCRRGGGRMPGRRDHGSSEAREKRDPMEGGIVEAHGLG